jgi:electron transport complex protein RnfC
MLERIKANGVVGLGGATFPTHVKLNPGPNAHPECLILNGAECEPFLTSDFRIMVERPKEIVVGAAIMQKILGGCKCVIGIEENKPEAIEAMGKAVAELGYQGISVQPLKKRYPQGGEKQLIDAVMHRQVKSGALPISVGAVVQNVATSLAVYEAVQKNRPLITNTLTVTGDCLPVEKQHNYLFRIGVPLSFIAEYAGGIPEGAAKLVSGGPMMGRAISNIDACTVKGSSSILYLSEALTKRKPESNCIRCGKCADACPMGLEPFFLNRLYKAGDLGQLEDNAAQDCIECGCCLYSCPANIPLLDNIRQAKGQVMGVIRARAAAAKAATEAAKNQ